jgi:hypothetical protein
MPTNRPTVTHQLPGPGVADLMELPWAFSQRGLLSAEKFRDECRRRGVSIRLDEELETLHREGVLIPLARRDGGHVEEPALVGFRPWRSYPPSTQFLYSPYQLLAVPDLYLLLPRMTLHRQPAPMRLLSKLLNNPARPPRPRQVRFDLDLSSPVVQLQRSGLPSRELVIALSALEARYLPDILQQGRVPRPLSVQDWLDYADGFDPKATLDWLGWRPEQLKDTAYRLLGRAHDIDPQQRWHRLARLVEPTRWADLGGLALAANDDRVAAEVLLHCYEDLVERDAAPPLEQLPPGPGRVWHFLDERLATDRDELEEVLTHFGLSPHPSVVLAVEGETEELTVERIIKLLVPPDHRDRIRVRNLHGTSRDLTMLAPEVARPFLGAQARHDELDLLQPPTRLLMTGDPEHKLATPTACADQHRKLVDQIDATLRLQNLAVDREDLESLVEIRTWGAYPFEFAHFTDDELARAALPQSRPGHPLSTQDLAAAFGQIRATTKKIAEIGATLRSTLDKVELADALWPVLKAKIQARVATGSLDDVPIAAAVWRAAELAREPRRNVVARLASQDPAPAPRSPGAVAEHLTDSPADQSSSSND